MTNAETRKLHGDRVNERRRVNGQPYVDNLKGLPYDNAGNLIDNHQVMYDKDLGKYVRY